MSNQSVLLTRFYVDYYAWVRSGAHDQRPKTPFSRSVGLCSNLTYWMKFYGFVDWFVGENSNERTPRALVAIEQDALFMECFKNDAYPFGKEDYDIAFIRDTQHLNTRRIEWVFSRIN